jgi:hypothetical protein
MKENPMKKFPATGINCPGYVIEVMKGIIAAQ